MFKPFAAILLALTLSGCADVVVGRGPAPAPTPIQSSPATAPRALPGALAEYRVAAARIERAATAMCLDVNPGAPRTLCDYDFRLIDDPRLGANAFQTLQRDGSPVVGMSVQLVAETQNADEIAFILGHEAAHHIAGHIPKSRTQAMAGALVLGTLAGLGNASDAVVRDMMDLGASLGGRAYSQTYELEADVLGARIAARAGFDPERGARVFTRPVLASDGGLLSTHPPSQQRQAAVAATAAQMRRQGAGPTFR